MSVCTIQKKQVQTGAKRTYLNRYWHDKSCQKGLGRIKRDKSDIEDIRCNQDIPAECKVRFALV